MQKLFIVLLLLLIPSLCLGGWGADYGLIKKGTWYQPENIPGLIKVLRVEQSAKIIAEAAKILSKIDRNIAAKEVSAALATRKNSDIVKRLLNALVDLDRDKAGYYYLLAASSEPDSRIKVRYVERALKYTPKSERKNVLAQAAEFDDDQVTFFVFRSLLRSVPATDPLKVKVLTKTLRLREPKQRMGALKYIYKHQKYYRDQSALLAVVEGIASDDVNAKVKRMAVKIVGRIEPAAPVAVAVATKQPTPVQQPTTPKPLISSAVFDDVGEINPSIAVIIGNRNYSAKHRDVPDVTYAHNDADAIKSFALNGLGYDANNLMFLKDATQAEMTSIFGNQISHKGKLYNWVKPGESEVFIYYSGHGAPSLNDGKGYLLPVDADPTTVELNGLALETLYANLAKLPAKRVTVVLDACFSGSSSAGSLVKSASSISLRRVEAKTVSTSKLNIISAAGLSEVASWDEKAQHGMLTGYFIRAVNGLADGSKYGNNDGQVTFGEIKKYLGVEVTYRARREFNREQHPEVTGDAQAVLVQLH